MIKKLLFALLVPLFTFPAFAQNFNIKDFSLRDYKAPRIKYRRLDFGTNLNSNGSFNTKFTSDKYHIGGNVDLYYTEYLNSPNFQGQIVTIFATGYGYNNSKSNFGNNVDTKNNFGVFFSYADQNRWYNENNKFFGLHTLLSYNYDWRNTSTALSDSSLQTSDFRNNNFEVTLYLSFGTGRIEPVAPARKAMDILLSLQKYDRLSRTPNSAMIDSLAHIANQVQFRRFYDRRFKRIYQLEELDKGIQGMGLVDNPDMVYAANLSDIWDFAFDFNRGAGNRWEFGAIPVFYFDDGKSTIEDTLNLQIFSENFTYGFYGFGSWNHLVPLSYKWQSDIMIDLTAGWGESISRQLSNSSAWSELLNMSWSLGYFPTTRTYMGITPYGRVSLTQTVAGPEPEKDLGFNTGLDFRSYFYVSPRFRINLDAGLSYFTSGYNNGTPMPYWNTSANVRPAIPVPNQIVSPHLLDSSSRTPYFSDRFTYELFVTFTYAIL